MSAHARTISRGRLYALVPLLFALVLALGSLTGCGGSSEAEQDNCYGEDMPVINE